jgi:hypothetical protein
MCDLFDNVIREFESPTEADRGGLAAKAAGIWIGYPLLGEAIECVRSATDEEKYSLRYELNCVHYAATRFLAVEAERVGLNPAPLVEGHRVCLQLFNGVRMQSPPRSNSYGVAWFHHPDCIYDTWPDCLGPWRYDLPPAMQEMIRQGEEVFTQLITRPSVSRTDASNAWETLNQKPAAKGPSESVETEGEGKPTDASPELPDLVTLDQAAAAAHVSKRTLERHKTEGTLPEPARDGGGGRFALYDWKIMRPWLMQKFGVPLPERFPANRQLTDS